MNQICPRFYEMKDIMGSRKTETPVVVNSNRSINDIDSEQLDRMHDEQSKNDDVSTDYDTTDDEESVEVDIVPAPGVSPVASPLSSPRASSSIPRRRAESSNVQRRKHHKVEDMILRSAEEANKAFMDIMTSNRTQEIQLQKEQLQLEKDKFLYQMKMDRYKVQVNAFLEATRDDHMSVEERMARINQIYADIMK